MNQIIATAQQILDFKVGNISVGSVIQGLVLLIIFNRIISMIMGPIIDKVLDRFKLETTVQGFIKGFIKVILNFVALCVVADSIGIPIASVLAVVGMLGLAISLSVQGALSNVANGFLILVTKPFKVGDYVAIAGIEGFVKDVSMLCTKVLTVDNKLIIVPNSEAMGGKITNFSAEDLRRVDIETKAGYDNQFEDVYKAVLEAVMDTPTALQDPAPFVRVSGYTDYAVVYTIRVWTKSANYWDCYFDLMQKVGEFKDKNGVVGGVPSMRYISDK
ncbi:MAG: mechanosensitive ion channel family protein [Acidaminococcaceae bacterium]|nr:mechanosensitive ion channel family protein [Acidaminococcaceae bacterium]